MNTEKNEQVASQRKRSRSRKLSILDYFRVLQVEALNAELRSRIYTKKSDRNFWKSTYEKKKQAALDIAERNKVGNTPLPSIFTDEEMMASIRAEVYGTGGFPSFTYANEEQSIAQSYLDSMCYYAIGTEVACDSFGEIIYGKVKSYIPNSKTVEVERITDKEVITMPISHTTRIL